MASEDQGNYKFAFGNLVYVKGCWSTGKCSSGGVGVVQSREVADGVNLYVVKYILGGREKRITESRIRFHDVNADNAMDVSSQESLPETTSPSASTVARAHGEDKHNKVGSDPASEEETGSLEELAEGNDKDVDVVAVKGDGVSSPAKTEERDEKAQQQQQQQEACTPVRPSKRARVGCASPDTNPAVSTPGTTSDTKSITVTPEETSPRASRQQRPRRQVSTNELGTSPREAPTEVASRRRHGSSSPVEEEEVMVVAAEKENNALVTKLSSHSKAKKATSHPTGVVGGIVDYLIEINRPVGIAAVVAKLKQDFTKTQVDKGMAHAVEQGYVSFSEEGARLYWISQAYLTERLARDEEEEEENENDAERGAKHGTRRQEGDWEAMAERLQVEKNELESTVTRLLTAPGEEELARRVKETSEQIALLEARVRECDEIQKRAEAMGKSGAELHAATVGELKQKLAFFGREARERRKIAEEFLQNVVESKGLKSASARREFYEKVGVEMD